MAFKVFRGFSFFGLPRIPTPMAAAEHEPRVAIVSWSAFYSKRLTPNTTLGFIRFENEFRVESKRPARFN